MNYKETLEYIHSVCWKGSIPGLERITELCERLGNPQNSLKYVHIAGTNGKGSVSTVIAEVLKKAGYRVGLFTSPYLIDFKERIVFDGEMIAEDELCEVCGIVKNEADKMKESPTEFELITAIAFKYFEMKKCDIVVLECGMGGRLDSTNVIENPEVSVITNIALDHVAVLGDTEAKIAAEKAGIIKKSPVVAGKIEGEAFDVISNRCRENSVDLISYSDIKAEGFEPALGKLSFMYNGRKMTLPLCGLYQRDNVRCALGAVEVLQKKGWEIDLDSIEKALSEVIWSARFETLNKEPLIIFDGAHNENGMTSAVETFETLMPGIRPVAVTGVMADKDHGTIVKLMSRIVSKVYTVKPDNPRALSADDYAAEFRSSGVDAEGCESVKTAVEKAVLYAGNNGLPVFCAGSLYMYAEVRQAVCDIFTDKVD